MEAKILIIEDDLFTLESIVYALKIEGYTVEKASSPKEALAELAAGVPNLILMDIDLNSDMDGIELAAKIHKKHSDIPILYLTDKTDSRIVERARNIHNAYYMTKPFENAILLSQIELMLSRLPATTKTKPESLFVRVKATDSHKTAIPFDQIYYLRAQRVYCELHYLPEGQKDLSKVELSISMSDTLQKLPNDRFTQVHRSYCVNVQKIEGIDRHDLILRDRAVPFSKKYRDQILEYINQA